MKKILILLLVLFSVNSSLYSKDDVTVKSGSLYELKARKDVKVNVVWDYTKSTIEGKSIDTFLNEKGQEWVSAYPKEIETAETWFKDKINQKTKTINVVDSKAEYVITVNVSDFHYGSTGLSVMVGFGSGNAHLSGKVIFTKVGSTEPIAILDVDGVPGSGFGNEKRRCSSYEKLGKWIVKLISDAKKK
jgi:hypothetical protein